MLGSHYGGITDFLGEKPDLSEDIACRQRLADLNFIVRSVSDLSRHLESAVENEKNISPGIPCPQHGIAGMAGHIMS